MNKALDIRVIINSQRTREAFRRGPEIMRGVIGDAVWRGALAVATLAREKAPKSFSALTNSINATKVDELHWQVDAPLNYAAAVEEGTGPAVGKPRYYPNPDSLLEYIRSPSARRHDLARKGSRKRGEQDLETWFRSRALAWHIFNHGTKPNPYMQPAAEEGSPRVIDMIRQAIGRGVREVEALGRNDAAAVVRWTPRGGAGAAAVVRRTPRGVTTA